MSDIVRFLNDRLKEDDDINDTPQEQDDVRAKMETTRLHGPLAFLDEDCADVVCRSCGSEQFPCRTLRLVAYPYRRHPDFCPDWADGILPHD